MRSAAVVALVGIVLSGLAIAVFLRTDPSPEIDVYAAVLQHQLSGQRPDLAVMSKATDCGAGERLAGEFGESLTRSFRDANVRGRPAPDLAALESFVDVATYTGAGLTRNGEIVVADEVTLVYLSRVGFSEDGTQALVCLESPWQANAYLLRAGNTWTVIGESTLWML